jgi:hypothetical protein
VIGVVAPDCRKPPAEPRNDSFNHGFHQSLEICNPARIEHEISGTQGDLICWIERSLSFIASRQSYAFSVKVSGGVQG